MISFHSLINPVLWENPAKVAVAAAVVVMIAWEFRKGYFQNFKAYLTTLSLRPYTALAGIFFLLFLFTFLRDQALMAKARALQGPFWSGVLLLGRNIGENKKFWCLLLFFYWTARAFRSEKGSAVAFGALLTSAAGGLLAHAFKFVFMRARPYEGLGPYSFFHYSEIFGDSSTFESLPSGDVTLVSGAVGYLFFSIPNPVFRAGILLIPFSNAFARMSLNRHWPSDTIMGMGIGLMAAYFFHRFKSQKLS